MPGVTSYLYIFSRRVHRLRAGRRKEAFALAELITSRDNESVKYACKLGQSRAFRQSEGRFLAEGLKLCLELARALVPYKVYYTAKALRDCPHIAALGGAHCEVSEPVAEKLAQTQAPQGLFVVFSLPQTGLAALRAEGRYVLLEQVQDPSNVGAVLRSAAAFGFDGAVLTAGCADAFSGKAARASMGAVAHLAVVQNVVLEDALAACRTQGLALYAAALQNARPLEQVNAPPTGLVLLVGNEGAGLSPQAVGAADVVVRIPMTDRVESLNAAVAASVLLWHFRGV